MYTPEERMTLYRFMDAEDKPFKDINSEAATFLKNSKIVEQEIRRIANEGGNILISNELIDTNILANLKNQGYEIEISISW